MGFDKSKGTGIAVIGDGAQNIVEAVGNIQVGVNDDIINCDGTFNVTLVNFASATRQITITSTNGTITILGDATIESPTVLTTGMSVTLYPADSEWRQK